MSSPPPSYDECSKAYPAENMPHPPGHGHGGAPLTQNTAPYGSQNPGVYPTPGGMGYAPAPPQGSYAYPGPSPGYPPGSYPYGPPQPSVTNVIVMAQPMAVQTFQEYPTRTQCQRCNKEVLTQTEYVAGGASWLWCFVLALMGCLFGCCVIPFFVPSCMDVEHKCPECGETMGKWIRRTSRQGGYHRRHHYDCGY